MSHIFLQRRQKQLQHIHNLIKPSSIKNYFCSSKTEERMTHSPKFLLALSRVAVVPSPTYLSTFMSSHLQAPSLNKISVDVFIQ